MWFKNLRIYQITDTLQLDANRLEQALAEHKFTPCMSQDALKIGFTTPLHPSLKGYFYQVDDLYVFAVRRQEKVLPAAAIEEEMQPKIAAAEQEKGRPLSRKEKQAMKEETTLALLPRAFSRSVVTQAIYDASNNHLLVNTSSATRAEELLALLRKALGSLPAVPWLDSNLLTQSMQQWLAGQDLPVGMQLGHEAELKAPDDEGAKVKFSNHLLTTDDVQSHLEDKLVTRLQLQVPEQLSFLICEDGSLKKLQFEELLADKNDELGWDDVAVRLEADLLVMNQELQQIIATLRQQVKPLVKG